MTYKNHKSHKSAVQGTQTAQFQLRSCSHRLRIIFFGFVPDSIILILQALVTLNLQVALFRDLLLDVGGPKDGPSLREKVRRVRLGAVEAVARTYQAFLPHIKE